MKVVASLLLCLLFTGLCGYAQTPNNRSGKEAEHMLKAFYTKYITAVATDDGPASESKMKQLQQQFCTRTFLKKMPDLLEQTDSDLFLKAQDTSLDYLKTLTITQTPIPNQYRVSYMGDVERGKKRAIVIRVTVVKEQDGFKIAGLD
jgi:hypothetical protein